MVFLFAFNNDCIEHLIEPIPTSLFITKTNNRSLMSISSSKAVCCGVAVSRFTKPSDRFPAPCPHFHLQPCSL